MSALLLSVMRKRGIHTGPWNHFLAYWWFFVCVPISLFASCGTGILLYVLCSLEGQCYLFYYCCFLFVISNLLWVLQDSVDRFYLDKYFWNLFSKWECNPFYMKNCFLGWKLLVLTIQVSASRSSLFCRSQGIQHQCTGHQKW